MFVDKLRLAVAPQQQGEIVEPGDDSLKLHAFHQKHGDGGFASAQGVEENILEILVFIGHIGLLFLAAEPLVGCCYAAKQARGLG
jgi:hypothetical protein